MFVDGSVILCGAAQYLCFVPILSLYRQHYHYHLHPININLRPIHGLPYDTENRRPALHF